MPLQLIPDWLLLALAGGLVATPLLCAAPTGLDRAQALDAVRTLWNERQTQLRSERATEMQDKVIRLGDKSMRWEERVYGAAPAGGRSLWM